MRLEWMGERRFQGTDRRGVTVPIGEGAGPKAADLLPLSLAACTAIGVVGVIEKQRLAPEDIAAEIETEQAPDPPHAYTRIGITFVVKCPDIEEHHIERAIAAGERHCTVRHSLDPGIQIEIGYRIEP